MVRKLVTISALLVVMSGYMFIAGCESDAQTGGLIGAGVGALAGQAIGGNTTSTLIGTAVGGGAGYVVGNERDKKKEAAKTEGMRQEIAQMNYQPVNVTNSNGSIIQVKITRDGVGYRGPRNEYYPTLPTEDQLRPVYGF